MGLLIAKKMTALNSILLFEMRSFPAIADGDYVQLGGIPHSSCTVSFGYTAIEESITVYHKEGIGQEEVLMFIAKIFVWKVGMNGNVKQL